MATEPAEAAEMEAGDPQFINPGQGVMILLSDFIKSPVINTHAK